MDSAQGPSAEELLKDDATHNQINLSLALKKEDWTEAAILIQKGTPIDNIEENAKELIFLEAVNQGFSEAVRFFINKGVIQLESYRYKDGNTALHLAIEKKSNEVLKIFLDTVAQVFT